MRGRPFVEREGTLEELAGLWSGVPVDPQTGEPVGFTSFAWEWELRERERAERRMEEVRWRRSA